METEAEDEAHADFADEERDPLEDDLDLVDPGQDPESVQGHADHDEVRGAF